MIQFLNKGLASLGKSLLSIKDGFSMDMVDLVKHNPEL